MSETPEFAGKCAFALSMGPAEKAPQGKASSSLVIDGKTYFFMGVFPKFMFRLMPGSLQRAQRHWDAASK